MSKLSIKTLSYCSVRAPLCSARCVGAKIRSRKRGHNLVQSLFHTTLIILDFRRQIIDHLVQPVDRGGHARSPKAGAVGVGHNRKVGNEDAVAIVKVATVTASGSRKRILLFEAWYYLELSAI
jgi:hypothetical protein